MPSDFVGRLFLCIFAPTNLYAMRKLLSLINRCTLSIFLLLSVVVGQAQDDPTIGRSSLGSIEAGWGAKTITDVSIGMEAMLERFNQTWPTGVVGDVLTVMKEGAARMVLDESTGYEVINDFQNGYVKASDKGSERPYMSACLWQRVNGHRLLAIVIGQPVNPEKEIICFYDYDPRRGMLIPEPHILDGWTSEAADSRLVHVLPHADREFSITEHFTDGFGTYLHHFSWNGMKPVFEFSELGDDAEEEMKAPIVVDFLGSQPKISDFVTAVLSQGDLGDMVSDMAHNWRLRMLKRELEKGTKFFIDDQNDYIRYEHAYTPLDVNYIELRFWNCTDGKRKLIAMNNRSSGSVKALKEKVAGLRFFSYDNQRHTLTPIYPYEVGADINDANAIFYLPRSGKDIGVSIRYGDESVWMMLRWDGNKFVRE